ncbi:M57 family metalloprotease [Tenacibaculum sp.]|nr:M57 family metalloprotease [Tenacibaculum sp.]
MFKTKIKVGYLLVAGLMLASCQSEETNSTDRQLSVEAQKTFDYLTQVEGYSPDLLEADYDTKSFLYDGDAAITFNLKSNIDQYENVNKKIEGTSKKNQWIGNSGVLYVNSRNITYYYEGSFPNEYKNALGWAAYHWSRANTNINFRRVTRRSDAHLFLSSYSDRGDRAWARAQLPRRDGKTGTWLSINRANAFNTSNNTTRMTLMIHELGHTLGFEHSDQTRGVRIPGTQGANYHARENCGSVMKSSVYNCNWKSGSTRAGWTRDDWTSIHWAY